VVGLTSQRKHRIIYKKCVPLEVYMSDYKENTREKTQSGDNVCFSADEKMPEDFLFCYQFVYENMPGNLCFPYILSCYGCHLVTEGSAVLQTDTGQYPIMKGDLFFTFPGFPYAIRNVHQCKYLYISFIGTNIEKMLEEYGIDRESPVAKGDCDLLDHWFCGLGKCTSNNLSILTKGILYYTLALLPHYSSDTPKTREDDGKDSVIQQIRTMIDLSYGNVSLSLEYVCHLYGYSSQYISRRFREEIGFSFSDYLQSTRMHHARVLLKDTEYPIQEIANGVGYSNPLYFSRVFRKCTGVSPSDFRKQNKIN